MMLFRYKFCFYLHFFSFHCYNRTLKRNKIMIFLRRSNVAKDTQKKKEGKKIPFLCCLRLWQNFPVTFFGITLSGALVLSLFLTTRDTLQTQNEKYLRTLGEMATSHFSTDSFEDIDFSAMENGQVPKEVADTIRHIFEQGSDIYSFQILIKTRRPQELMVLFADQRFDRDRNGDGAISASEEVVPVGTLLPTEHNEWLLRAFGETTFDSKTTSDALGALRLVATPAFFLSDEYKGIVLLEIDQKQHLQNLSTIRWHAIGIFFGFVLLVILVSSFVAQQEHIRARLEQTNALKDEFVGIVSHELRTPMTVVRGFIEFLNQEKYGSLNRQQKSILEKIHRNISDLLHLVNDMLDIRTLEMGKMQFRQEPFLVSDFVRNVVQDFQVVCEEKKLSLDITHLDVANVFVFADIAKTREVLVNLIGNAAKFTPVGGNIELSFDSTLRSGFLVFSVRDTGVGISPEEQERIFEKFHQVENKELGKAKGTGLGLSITREILQQMGGEIWLTSELGIGTTFFFTLPLSHEPEKNSYH